MSKFVFVTGGVVSSIGKGIVAASLGRLLKSRGYSVSILKLDAEVLTHLATTTVAPGVAICVPIRQ